MTSAGFYRTYRYKWTQYLHDLYAMYDKNEYRSIIIVEY